jgi:hypothetical protein
VEDLTERTSLLVSEVVTTSRRLSDLGPMRMVSPVMLLSVKY